MPVHNHTTTHHHTPPHHHTAPRTPHHAPRTTHLAPRTSHLAPRTSHLAPQTHHPFTLPSPAPHTHTHATYTPHTLNITPHTTHHIHHTHTHTHSQGHVPCHQSAKVDGRHHLKLSVCFELDSQLVLLSKGQKTCRKRVKSASNSSEGSLLDLFYLVRLTLDSGIVSVSVSVFHTDPGVQCVCACVRVVRLQAQRK